mmetsp:Transcript_13319/g.28148  ORF Transcript_13319/g.28148 Transcript_13319/m.28148 type:complete len:236 (+) Transcript_13319:1032-1739(+)
MSLYYKCDLLPSLLSKFQVPLQGVESRLCGYTARARLVLQWGSTLVEPHFGGNVSQVFLVQLLRKSELWGLDSDFELDARRSYGRLRMRLLLLPLSSWPPPATGRAASAPLPLPRSGRALHLREWRPVQVGELVPRQPVRALERVVPHFRAQVILSALRGVTPLCLLLALQELAEAVGVVELRRQAAFLDQVLHADVHRLGAAEGVRLALELADALLHLLHAPVLFVPRRRLHDR